MSDSEKRTGRREKLIRNPHSALRNAVGAFTMIEIAICLAIIGIALVAIIGVLPLGMNVQRDNREEHHHQPGRHRPHGGRPQRRARHE